MRYQSDGEDGFVISDPNNPTPTKPVPDATPAPPLVRQGGVVTRYQDGIITVLADGRDHRAENALASQGVTVRTNAGPTSLALAGSDAIVDFGDGRETNCAAAVLNGWLLPRAGGGYELPAGATMAPAAKPEPTPEEKKAEEKANEISLEGVEGTSAGADIVHGQIRKAAGEATYTGLVQAYINNNATAKDAMVREIASQTGQPEQHVREATDGVFSEYERSAKQVAAANGVPARAWDAMLAWASAEQPDAAMDAMRDLVENHGVTGLARLARSFARTGRVETAYSVQDVLSARLGNGIKAREVNGIAMLDIPGHGAMPFDAAVRAGIIKLSR